MTIQLGRTRPIEQIQYPGRKDGGGVAGHIHKFWAPKHQQQQQPQSFVKSKTPQPTATKSTIITSTKNQQQQSEPQSNSKPQQQQSNPKLQPQQLSNPKTLTAAFVKSKTPQPTTAIIQPTQNQNQQPQQSIPKPLQAFMKSKTPQPTTKSTIASQKKVVSFWETQTSSNSSVLGRNVKTSTSLINTCSKSMSSLNQDQPEIEEKRGFIPSEVAKDPMKKEFLINLSKKIFSPNDQSKRRKSLKVSKKSFQKNPIIQNFLDIIPPRHLSFSTHTFLESLLRLGEDLLCLPSSTSPFLFPYRNLLSQDRKCWIALC